MFFNTRDRLLILGAACYLVAQVAEASTMSTLNNFECSHCSNPVIPAALEKVYILGSSTVTNTGLTVVKGNVAVYPGTAITGFLPGVIVSGEPHGGDLYASKAHVAALAYYNQLKAKTCPPSNNLTGQDLGGKTLAPGVYCFDSSAQMTGVLILNGPKCSSYTFQIGSTLTTAVSSKVVLTGGVSDVNWAIGSSATLGAYTTIQGIIDAVESITVTSSATIKGRAWALNGAVTLDDNAVNL
jgi:hypothetical protein